MYKNKIEEIIITFTDNKYTKIFDFEKEFYNINNICLEKKCHLCKRKYCLESNISNIYKNTLFLDTEIEKKVIILTKTNNY